MTANPCQTCGACCAGYRVSFYWGEADDAPGGIVPAQLTETVTPHLRCMKGMAGTPVRCVALAGEVGKRVSCRIYPRRPSTCREFGVLEADGSPNPHCAALRAKFGRRIRELTGAAKSERLNNDILNFLSLNQGLVFHVGKWPVCKLPLCKLIGTSSCRR